jgi:uncharacterized protein YecE (DUF72 family)
VPGSGAVQQVMPRFANTRKARKRNSDILQKLQRLLTASRSRHTELQRENQQLQLEFHLLKSFCEGLGKPLLSLLGQVLRYDRTNSYLRHIQRSSWYPGCGSDAASFLP